jgi:hypothetical protein
LSGKKKWRKLDGSSRLAEAAKGAPFKDGTKQTICAAQERRH